MKQSKKSKIMSTKRKIGEKVPPINFKSGIRGRIRKRTKPTTTDLTCGPGKNDSNLSPAPRVGAAQPEKNCHH